MKRWLMVVQAMAASLFILLSASCGSGSQPNGPTAAEAAAMLKTNDPMVSQTITAGGLIRCEETPKESLDLRTETIPVFGTAKYGNFSCSLYSPGFGHDNRNPLQGVANSYLVECHTPTTCTVTPAVPASTRPATYSLVSRNSESAPSYHVLRSYDQVGSAGETITCSITDVPYRPTPSHRLPWDGTLAVCISVVPQASFVNAECKEYSQAIPTPDHTFGGIGGWAKDARGVQPYAFWPADCVTAMKTAQPEIMKAIRDLYGMDLTTDDLPLHVLPLGTKTRPAATSSTPTTRPTVTSPMTAPSGSVQSPQSCAHSSGTPVNEVATPAVKRALRAARLSAAPAVPASQISGPLFGKTYLGAVGKCEYAVAMFSTAQTGTTHQPDIFERLSNGKWSDTGDTAGCIAPSRIPAPLLRLWAFRKTSEDCFAPPAGYFSIKRSESHPTRSAGRTTQPSSREAAAYGSGYSKCFGVSHGFYVSPDMHDQSTMSTAERAGCSDAVAKRGSRLFAGLPTAERQAITVVENEQDWQVVDASHFGTLGERLHALLGVQESGGSGTPTRVFFFFGSRYLGTDTSQPSEDISIVSNSGSTVVVKYTVWRSGDPHCCPTGESQTVRFHWTGSKLQALDPIPPVSARY